METKYASINSRVIAFVIDTLVLGLSKLITGMVFGMVMLGAFGQDPKTASQSSTSQFIFIVLHLIMAFLVFVLPTYRNGKTLGKGVMKIKVDFGEEKPSLMKVTFREYVAKLWPLHFAEFGFFAMVFSNDNIAALIPAILYLFSALTCRFNGEKKSIHDLIAGTSVVRENGTL